jgi:hypothetical protein
MKTQKRKGPKKDQHIIEWFMEHYNYNMSNSQFKELIKEAKEYEELRGLAFFRKGMEFQFHETHMNECK